MKRILLALVLFWLALVTALVVVAVNAEEDEPRVDKPPGPFSCASLQRRAERCAHPLSDLAGELIAAHLKRSGESAASADVKAGFATSLVYNAITEKRVATYCRHYWDDPSTRIRRLREGVRVCYAKPGCDAFVGCLRQLARTVDFTDL